MFQFVTAGKIVFGAGALHQLAAQAQPLGARAFVVLGASGRFEDRVLPGLHSAGLAVAQGNVSGEPTVQGALQLVQQARAHRADVVVAVGGGSVLDAGKALAALLPNRGEVLDYLEVVGRGQPLLQASLPFIAVPTTAGTGAEVTKNAVLCSPDHGVKVSLRSDSMLPTVALVDPELTVGLPPELTASTGLDALTQVLEPYVSCFANPMTDALSHKGLSLASTALRASYHQGKNLSARTDMAMTSVLGGLALANAKLGAVHGIAGPLGGMLTAPHGAVCARLLPGVFRMNTQRLAGQPEQAAALGRFEQVAQVLTGRPRATVEDGAQWLEQLVDELRVPGLARYGLTRQQLPELAEKSQRASSMRGNPVTLSSDDLMQLIEAAL